MKIDRGIIKWQPFNSVAPASATINKLAKENQELKSLRKIGDSFQKIVIVGNDIAQYKNDDGIIFMGLFQFLMNDDILK